LELSTGERGGLEEEGGVGNGYIPFCPRKSLHNWSTLIIVNSLKLKAEVQLIGAH
jgi:hypothetical protein